MLLTSFTLPKKTWFLFSKIWSLPCKNTLLTRLQGIVANYQLAEVGAAYLLNIIYNLEGFKWFKPCFTRAWIQKDLMFEVKRFVVHKNPTETIRNQICGGDTCGFAMKSSCTWSTETSTNFGADLKGAWSSADLDTRKCVQVMLDNVREEKNRLPTAHKQIYAHIIYT